MGQEKGNSSRRIAAHVPHPTTVCSVLCCEFLKMRKKMKRADTDAYRTPKKMIVGIMNEKATFLYVSWSEPKAGAVMYWFPVYA